MATIRLFKSGIKSKFILEDRDLEDFLFLDLGIKRSDYSTWLLSLNHDLEEIEKLSKRGRQKYILSNLVSSILTKYSFSKKDLILHVRKRFHLKFTELADIFAVKLPEVLAEASEKPGSLDVSCPFVFSFEGLKPNYQKKHVQECQDCYLVFNGKINGELFT